MQQMYLTGAINEMVFSFYLTDVFSDFSSDGLTKKAGSVLTIGGYDLEKYAKPNMEVHWHDLKSYFYWSVNLKSVKLKDAFNNTFDLGTR